MGQTVVEKIVRRESVGLGRRETVSAGDMVMVRPFHVLTHDNTGAIIPKFEEIGAETVADPSQPVFALDHNVQDRSEANLAKYEKIEAFAERHGIVFHAAGEGIGHQLMIERGFVHPGRLVVASDSHANMYGALSAVGTPVVRTDAAALWATGTTWWQVPRTVKVVLEGRLPAGSTGKDVALLLCRLYGGREILNTALELTGTGVAFLSMSDRMTIANMTTEAGALVGWFPFDEVTAAYLRERAQKLDEMGIEERLTETWIRKWERNPTVPDPDAVYDAEIRLDLGRVTPQVTGPHTVLAGMSAAEAAGQRIAVDKAYLLSCVNGRLDDLRQAAEVLRGRKVADGVELYVAAASAEVEAEARADGTWAVLEEAGAIALPPGCGACIGLGKGLLEPGEVGISATNRNFRGRMGSRDAEVYLGSPAVVAASAATGFITAPEGVAPADQPERDVRRAAPPPGERSVEILEGFAKRISGRGLLLPVDNLNTDGIYGKDVTYRDDLSPEEMADHAMLNYDPRFQDVARAGDIIIAGSSFGTGSSREQAATALKFRGIQLVIAESFSQTYLRNAFNNAFICLESPELARAVRERFADDGRATIPFDELIVDFRDATVAWKGSTYPVSPLGPQAQKLILAGGLLRWAQESLGSS